MRLESLVISPGTRATPVSVDREAEILSRVEYRLMESPEEREEVYRLRYRAYLQESTIAPNGSERIEDKFDHAPNSWIFGLYFEGASPVPSASACPCPARR